MKKAVVFFVVIVTVASISVAFRQTDNSAVYIQCYTNKIGLYKETQQKLLEPFSKAISILLKDWKK